MYILNYAKINTQVNMAWIEHKLANNLIYIGDTQSSHGEMHKMANKYHVKNGIINRLPTVLAIFDI